MAVAAVVGLTLAFTARGPLDPVLAKSIVVFTGQSLRTERPGGTTSSGFIQNLGWAPVDATVRFRALDVDNRILAEVLASPQQGIAPGERRITGAHCWATTVDRWEIEIVGLSRSPR